MTKEEKCMIAETIGEAILGAAIGVCLDKTVMPKCNGCEKAVVALGTAVGGWMIGRSFAKTFYKFCDGVFDTEFEDAIEKL